MLYEPNPCDSLIVELSTHPMQCGTTTGHARRRSLPPTRRDHELIYWIIRSSSLHLPGGISFPDGRYSALSNPSAKASRFKCRHGAHDAASNAPREDAS